MIEVKTDKIYTRMCERFGVRKDKYLFQDPYHRYLRILKYLQQNGLLQQETSCLDLGCLRPELASLLINNFKTRVTGIDGWDMLDDYPEIDMKFINTNLMNDFTTLITEKVDTVFALEVIEHMIDTDVFLGRISTCLKNKGLLVISTPNINNLRNRFLVPLGKYPSPMEYKNIIHHVRLYNVAAIKSQLTEHGFTVDKIFGVGFLPYRGPMGNKIYRFVSEKLADLFPSLCANMIIVARKKD